MIPLLSEWRLGSLRTAYVIVKLITQDCYSTPPGGGGSPEPSPFCLCCFPPPQHYSSQRPLPFTKTPPVERENLQLTDTEGGRGVGNELPHYGSNSRDTMWQEAAWEASNGGHPFPSSCPIRGRPTVPYTLHPPKKAQNHSIYLG